MEHAPFSPEKNGHKITAEARGYPPPPVPRIAEKESVFHEIGKTVSFFLSILSLYLVVMSAFFVPGSRWEDRLSLSLVKIALAGCICFASGLFFLPAPAAGKSLTDRLMETLPVRMFFWTLLGVVLLFALSWYLDVYFVPLMWRNQPYEIGVWIVAA